MKLREFLEYINKCRASDPNIDEYEIKVRTCGHYNDCEYSSSMDADVYKKEVSIFCGEIIL